MWINLPRITVISILFIASFFFAAVIYKSAVRPSFEIVYNCNEAETDLNFPVEVKDRCARLKKQLARY
jgi:hypothetical protein